MNPAPLAGGGGARAEPAASPNSPGPTAGQDVRAERAALMRDFVFEALSPVEADASAARACLTNDDDAGAHYHLKRVVECVKAAASTFRELQELVGGGQ